MSPTLVTNKDKPEANLADSFSIIAKNFLLLPGIARDLNEAVQSIVGIVKQKGGEAKESPDEKFIVEKDFQAKEKLKAPTSVTEGKVAKKKGILGSLMGMLSPKKMIKNLIIGFRKLLSPKNIMKVLGKIALPVLIVSTIWVAISSAFEKWKETGSIWEAYKEAVGSVVEFLTLGFIDKETIKNLYQGAADFLMPVIKPIREFFGKFSDWVGEKFNGVLKLFGIDVKPKEAPQVPQKEQVVTPGTLRSEQPVKEKDAQQKAADLLSKPVTLPSEPPPPKPEVEPAAPTPTILAPEAAPTPAPIKKGKAPQAKESKPAKIGSESGKKAVINELNAEKIEDPTARAAILAQVAHESGGFTTLSENLNYKAPTLLKLFPKKFMGPDDAQQVSSGGPQTVAERIYGGRMGNAPEGSGDGFKYRGRGFIQLTGKDNYKRFGYDGNPDDLTKPEGAAESAIKFMKGYKGDWSNITAVTKFVNGGTFGLAEREEYFQSFLNDPTITKIDSASSAPSGGSVASASSEVSSGQRQQAKPQTPMVVNAPTTNNTKVVNNQPATITKDKSNPTNMVLARVA